MYKTILAATDGSESAEAAVREAASLAASQDATLHLVTVVDAMGYGVADVRSEIAADALREEARERLEQATAVVEERGVAVEATILDGAPAASITDQADAIGADLVVVGTHGRRGLGRVLLGSVAERVARTAPCSVLVARDESAEE